MAHSFAGRVPFGFPDFRSTTKAVQKKLKNANLIKSSRYRNMDGNDFLISPSVNQIRKNHQNIDFRLLVLGTSKTDIGLRGHAILRRRVWKFTPSKGVASGIRRAHRQACQEEGERHSPGLIHSRHLRLEGDGSLLFFKPPADLALFPASAICNMSEVADIVLQIPKCHWSGFFGK